MSDEPYEWLRYAAENYQVAMLCLEDGLLNPCLQNAQQAIEKSLKASCLAKGVPLKHTHNITELVNTLRRVEVSDLPTLEECALIDSIYLPSKYPLGSVLPHFEPDAYIAAHCLAIAERSLATARHIVNQQ